MITSSFYNDNLFRQYPFIQEGSTDTSGLPTQLIVGVKVICSYDSPFTSFPRAWLKAVQVAAEDYYLFFVVKDKKGTQLSVTVPVPKTVKPFDTVSASGVLIAKSIKIVVTVGNLIPEEDYNGLEKYVEPTCILWLKHRGISQINAYNKARNRLNSIAPHPSHEKKYWYTGSLVSEPLLIHAGFNCFLATSRGSNNFNVLPRAFAGSGPVQGFPLLSKEEEFDPLVDKIRPDGLFATDDSVYVFSGATGPVVTEMPGNTIRFTQEFGPSSIVMTTAKFGKNPC